VAAGAALAGGALGPIGVGVLWHFQPRLSRIHLLALAALLVAELYAIYARAYPTSPCVTDAPYLLNQVQNGLSVGLVFATMAAGLTLIYSVQRIISFSHGQFVMFGGVTAFLALSALNVNAIVVVPLVAILTFVVGGVVAVLLLGPVRRRTVERPDEFALLMTFGLGVFLAYALVGILGSPSAIRAPRYTDRPIFGLSEPVFLLGSLRIRVDLLIAGGIGLIVFAGLLWFLYRTWTGRSFRAVSMDRDAAAAVGIDSGRVFILAFAIGTMLAGIAGAALVPTFNFQVPEMAAATAVRSYVIVVLGGLGSVFGALVGGLTIGVVEALTAACYPDPGQGATYQVVAGLLVFVIVLLVRPRGFFGGSSDD
jgi:branched-chain amino acid transport system permease protein